MRALSLGGWLATIAVLLGCQTEQSPPPRLERLTSFEGDEVSPRFSADGRYIAFSSDARGNHDLLVLELATGAIVEVATTAGDEREPSWSQDERLTFATVDPGGEGAVWTTDLTGSKPVRLSGPELDAFRPHWSPNADLIAFTADSEHGRQVWLSDPRGTAKRRLTDGAAHIAYGWSPDGTLVLTVSFAPDAQDVWAWPVEGGAPLRISSRTGEEWWPTWSPLGDRIAFYTTWDDEMTEIWTAEVTGGELERITDEPVEDFRPAWSPDGRWLAFSSDRQSKSGLWRQELASGVALPIALDGRAGGTPAWSPDGTSIAFSYLVSRPRLYRLSRDGGEPMPITSGERSVVEATVSPDGAHIAFESEDVGSEADLFTLDLATGTVRRLTDETAYNARPSWSHDGSRLALEHSPGGGPRTLDVATLPAGGGTRTLLTDAGYVRSPVWCGSRIVYTVEHSATDSGPDQLWTVSAEGGEPWQITFSPGSKRSSDCTADGQLAYFVRTGGAPRLLTAVLREDGSLSEPVDHGPGEGGRWSADGREVAFLSTRDGQPDLYILSMTDGTLERLTESAVAESWPDWIADTRDLVFSANPDGRDIWLARFSD